MQEIFHNDYGKPYDDIGFHFNLTHSCNWVGIAYGRKQVGCDIERVVDETNYLSCSFLTNKEKKPCVIYQLRCKRNSLLDY